MGQCTGLGVDPQKKFVWIGGILCFHFSLSRTGERNGNPLQCSCLDNPRDGGAWWAAVYGVAQSRRRLKWLSSSSSINAGDIGSIPGLGRSPRAENGNPLQYSCLRNPTDKGVQWATVHGVATNQTRLSDWTYMQSSDNSDISLSDWLILTIPCIDWVLSMYHILY